MSSQEKAPTIPQALFDTSRFRSPLETTYSASPRQRRHGALPAGFTVHLLTKSPASLRQ